MPEPPIVEPQPGDRFTILRLHAQGGLGQVSLARDEKLKRQVALKEIRPDKRDNADLRQRFLVEAEITGQLEHPGIVPIYDLDQDADGQVRYAMRFVQGRTLRDAIRAYHKQPTLLAFRELLQRFVSVCKTMAYAHSQGVIHRDLKPANILLGDYGETLVVDWGLAKRLTPPAVGFTVVETPTADPSAVLDETTDFRLSATDERSMTQAGQILGTLAYMSPEQAAGDIEATRTPADIYGLGAVLYELLTGHTPYEGMQARDALAAIRDGELVRPAQIHPAVPRALEAVCLKAMACEIRGRYATAADLASDIERWLADEPVSAYHEPLWNRLVRWQRRHQTLVISVTVLTLTALIVGGVTTLSGRRERERALALGQVAALQEAAPSAVPYLLSALDASRADVQSHLRQLWNQQDLPRGNQARAGLALLPVEPDEVRSRLLTMLLEIDDPQEFVLIRNRLVPHSDELTAPLWDEARQATTSPPRRFRLLVALAAFEPGSTHWTEVAGTLTDQLLNSNSLHVGEWTQALTPVRGALIAPLVERASQHRGAERGRTAVAIVSVYAADRPAVLTDLLLAGSPDQYEVLWPLLSSSPGTHAAMQHELNRVPESQAADAIQDELAARQANAAITLLKLGNAEPVWPLLRASSTPRLRTYLIHRLAALSVDPEILVRRLAGEPEPSIRQALFLSLGEYPPDQLTPQTRQELVSRSEAAFRDDPDPGIHSAADWLLRRLGETEALTTAEQPLISTSIPTDRRWYVTPAGDTFAVVPGPLEFPYFKFSRREGPDQLAKIENRVIPYSFAVATRKVTLNQFRRFLREHPQQDYAFEKPRAEDGSNPATQVTWIMAAQYCRWLSDLEQMPEAQMCFPEIQEIKEGLKMPADYVQRTGYRLPTVEEWECACRSGTLTRLFFGSDLNLLKNYGWHADNSGRKLHAVGLLKPSDLGLFDVYGLAYDFTNDEIYFSPEVEERIWRGSGRYTEPEEVATSPPGIAANRLTYVGNECGMRVVRTLPSSDRP